jgi:hypothetical protein
MKHLLALAFLLPLAAHAAGPATTTAPTTLLNTPCAAGVALVGGGAGLSPGCAGNATIGGTLGVTGAATFGGGLTGTLTGHASLDLPLTGGTVTGAVSLDPTGMASAPALTIFAWPTFATTVNPYLYTHGVPSGNVTSGQANYNYMAIDNDGLNTTGAGGPGGSTILGVSGNFNSISMTGNRTGLGAGITIAGPTGNATRPYSTAVGTFYTGAAYSATSNSDDGGTAGYERGNLFGENQGVNVGPGVLYWLSMVGQETDVTLDPTSSVIYKMGQQIIGSGPDGTLEDSAIVIGRGLNTNFTQNPGWRIGLAFGAPNVFWPISTTGTIIGTQATTQGSPPSMAAANGVDFSAVSFSGCAFKSTGYCIDGSGNVTANSVSATGGTSTAWSPSPLFGSTAPSSYTSSGRWYRLGPIVYVEGTITFTTLGSPSGNLSISNLPVSALSGSQGSMSLYNYNNSGAPSGTPTNPLLSGSQTGTTLIIYSQSLSGLTVGNFVNGAVLAFSGFYFAE